MKRDRKAYMKAYDKTRSRRKRGYRDRTKYRIAHKEQLKEGRRRWYLAHKEYFKTPKAREYNRAYYLAHREQQIKAAMEWQVKHPEKTKEINKKYKKKWRQIHSIELKEENKKYCLEHPEKKKKWKKRYQQSLKGKALERKMKASRKQLGFIPLNKPFIGCEGHHIDKERVIYMPRKIHREISHSVLRNHNMEAINKAAFEFIPLTMIGKSISPPSSSS